MVAARVAEVEESAEADWEAVTRLVTLRRTERVLSLDRVVGDAESVGDAIGAAEATVGEDAW